MPCLCLKQSSRYIVNFARYCTLTCTFEVCALLLADEFYSFCIYRLLLHYCQFSMHSHSQHFFCRKDQHFKSRAHSNQTCGRGDGPKPDLLPWPKANAPPFKPIHFFPRAAKLPPDTLGLRLARVTWIVFNLDAIGSKSHARLQQNICNIRYKASPSNQFF